MISNNIKGFGIKKQVKIKTPCEPICDLFISS